MFSLVMLIVCVLYFTAVGTTTTTALVLVLLLGVALLLECNRSQLLGTMTGYSASVLLIFAPPAAPPGTFAVAALSILTILFLSYRRAQDRPDRLDTIRARIVTWAIGIMWLTTGLASINHGSSTRVYIAYIPVGVMFFVCAMNFARRDLKAFTRWMVPFAMFQFIIAVIQNAGVSFNFFASQQVSTGIGYNFILQGGQRSAAMLAHPIVLSFLLVLSLILLWYYRGGFGWTITLFCTACFLYGIVLSGTRSAFVAIIVALAVGIIAPRMTLRGRIIGLFVLGSIWATLVLNTAVAQYVQNASNTLVASGSFTHRRGAFDSIPRILEARSGFSYLFGGGIGEEISLFERGLLQSDNFHVVDNQFVSMLIWSGVVGTVALLAAFAAALLCDSTVARVAVAVVAVYFNSFDVLVWLGPAALSLISFGWSLAPGLVEQRKPGKAIPRGTLTANDRSFSGAR